MTGRRKRINERTAISGSGKVGASSLSVSESKKVHNYVPRPAEPCCGHE